jgi:hypothetical protein
VQSTFNGLKFGLIIAMTAIGLSLIFGTTGLINFAHGDLVTLGAFLAYTFNVVLGLHLIVAALLSVALTAAHLRRDRPGVVATAAAAQDRAHLDAGHLDRSGLRDPARDPVLLRRQPTPVQRLHAADRRRRSGRSGCSRSSCG